MSRVIVFANRKGGCGKTTTAVNVAHGLTAYGTVLLVDMDAQAHVTSILTPASSPHRYSITQVLEQQVPLKQAIIKSDVARLSLVPSSRDLGAYELTAGGKEDSVMVLAEQLSANLNDYDYILIDPPPTLGVLMVTSLVAAREVYIPMPLHFLAMEGLAEMMQVIYRLNASYNPDLRLVGIIPTFFNKHTKTAKKISSEIETNFGRAVMMPGIRNNIKLAESPAFNQTIFDYSPRSNGAEDYRKLSTAIHNKKEKKGSA